MTAAIRIFSKNYGLLVLLLPLAVVDSLVAYVAWLTRTPFHVMVREFEKFRVLVPLVWAAIYGMQRVWTTHPVFKVTYHHWLATTPWRRGLKLPLGDVMLGWVDVVNIAALVGIDWYVGERWWIGLVPLLGAYHLVLSWALARTKDLAFAAALLFGFDLALALGSGANWAASLVVLAACYPLAWYAWEKSQLRFPWGLADRPKFSKETRDYLMKIGPAELPAPLSMRRVLTISFLVGFTAFAVTRHVDFSEKGSDVTTAAICVAFGWLVALVRFTIYCSGCTPPISFLGRVFTGNWIIPGYDRVLAAPFLLALMALVVPVGLLLAKVPPQVNCGVSGFLLLFAGLGLPPSRRKWRLTGHHRILMGAARKVS